MSYGYQGPPYAGQKPPTSFGLPPGTPSAPNAPPYAGYNAPPTSFNMPQPHSSPYPPQSMPMPSPMSMPMPSSNPMPSTMPMPGQYQPPYSHPQPSPYSNPSVPQPYQQNPPLSNPVAPQAYPQSPSPYSPMHGQPQHVASQGPGLYPSLNNVNQPYNSNPQAAFGSFPNSHPSSSSPYPGQSYSGGRGTDGNASPFGQPKPTNPYGAPAPRISPPWQKVSPTVGNITNFDPRSDAEILRKAMKGFGTDEKAIINVLCNRTNLQRQEIERQFKTLYGKDLIKDLKSELSGNLEKVILAMMTPLPQYFAKEIQDAISGIGTDEAVLIEVLCMMSNHEINVIKQAYQGMYGTTLEDDLRNDTSGSFKRLMVSLCNANRDESFNVDPAAAVNDARALLQAGELRFGTDESTFNAILCSRNVNQLHQIFAEYANLTGHDIEDAIRNEFSGDIADGLLAIVHCVKDRAGFFAEQLYNSMKGMGTDDQSLVRLVVSRSEIDMGEIKQAYQRKYGKTLEDAIADDCSGYYKKCLIALVS